jgi:hypothetical protein
MRDTGPTIVFAQYLSHPRVRTLYRTLEIDKIRPRARLRVSLDRRSKPDSAEVFYLRLPVHAPGWPMEVTNGGLPFVPGADQLPRTCKDFFAIDGRITYHGPDARVVVECADSPLVAFGGIYDGLMVEGLGSDLSAIHAMLYNNVWYTNFPGDECGRMDFAFDLHRLRADDAGYAPRVFAVVNV